MKPTALHAAAKALVRIPDGRTGRLIFAESGKKARVHMPSGVVLRFALNDLELV